MEKMEVFATLKKSVHSALENYSNIHRGSGHNSMVSTHLYEQAREIVLDYLQLNKRKYVVIFCTPRRAEILKTMLVPSSYQCISSRDLGLPIGLRAMAVKRNALPKGVPFQTGGGTARLVASGWVVWAKSPDRFEAGTPPIINVIAFAKALLMIKHLGIDAFKYFTSEKHTAAEILYHDKLQQFTGREMLEELRKTLIGGNLQVPTAKGIRPFINLDNAASTPTFEPIWNAVGQAWELSSDNQPEIIDEVRSICAHVLGAPRSEYDMIFTSNTTEAINLVAENLGNGCGASLEPVVFNTLLEHNSNDLPWRMTKGLSLIRLNINHKGLINLKELEKILSEYNQQCIHGNKRIMMVAVSGASNVLGVFNDLSEISNIVHQYGAQLLVDAAQMAAHRKIDMKKWDIDYLAFSAHKAYAPFGTGLLVAKKGLLNFEPAELKLIKSSGEENCSGIAALGKAFVLLQRIGFDIIQEEEHVLTLRALKAMSEIEGLKIHGIKDTDTSVMTKKGGVILFELKKNLPSALAKKLALEAGIGVRYGCHCAHMTIKHLLKIPPWAEQIQKLIVTLFPKVNLPGLTRISFGIENTEKDIDILISALRKIALQADIEGNQIISTTNETPVLSQKMMKQKMKDYIKTASKKVYA